MKIFKRALGLIATTAVCITPVWADINSSGLRFSAYGGVESASISPGWFALVGSETEFLDPSYRKTYGPVVGVGGAYRFMTSSRQDIFRYLHDVSLGLDVLYFRMKQNGNTLDFGMFDNFDYRLKIESLQFMLNSEWTFPTRYVWLFSFIEAGVGAAFNSASYTDKANGTTSSAVPLTMPSYTTTHFAYDVGAGVKVMMSKHTEMSLRYLYSDVGSAQSGQDATMNVTQSLNIPLKTQAWMLAISYLM